MPKDGKKILRKNIKLKFKERAEVKEFWKVFP